jgi:hypothetical protein
LIDEFPRSLLCLGALAGACAAVYAAFEALSSVLVAAVLLCCSMAPYLLPTYYELTEEGVRVSFLGRTRQTPWATIQRVRIDSRGVLLSPLPHPSRLDPFRSTCLRFSGNADEVLAFVSSKVTATR